MRIVITLSGEGNRFRRAGFEKFKPMVNVCGKPVIERLLEAFPTNWPKLFICNEEQAGNIELQEVLKSNGRVVTISGHKKGPVWSVLEAIRVAPLSIPDDEPLIVNYCDFSFRWKPHEFLSIVDRTGCSGAIFCYTGFHPEYVRPTQYAYCRTEAGRVLEVKEKGHFTPDRTKEFASSGSYYFKSGRLVRKYFPRVLEGENLINGEAFVSLAYNPMIRDGLDISLFQIDDFMQFGTPEDIRDYEYWSCVFSKGPADLANDSQEFNYWRKHFLTKQADVAQKTHVDVSQPCPESDLFQKIESIKYQDLPTE